MRFEVVVKKKLWRIIVAAVLAASLVVLTSVCSIVTMFLFIFALKQLGLV